MRKRTFNTTEQLKERIYEYFEWADKNKKPLTIARLGLYLGMSREELVNFKEGGKNADAINYAKDVILSDMEERMISGTGSTNGITFLIKNNFDYKDKKEHAYSGHITHEGFMNDMLEKANALQRINAIDV